MQRREFIKIMGLGITGFIAGIPVWNHFLLEPILQPKKLSFVNILLQSKEIPFLKLLGLGGLGSGIVEKMAENGVEGAGIKIENVPISVRKKHRGLDGGVEIGQLWAKESARDIEKYLKGSDVVVIIAGFYAFLLYLFLLLKEFYHKFD